MSNGQLDGPRFTGTVPHTEGPHDTFEEKLPKVIAYAGPTTALRPHQKHAPSKGLWSTQLDFQMTAKNRTTDIP